MMVGIMRDLSFFLVSIENEGKENFGRKYDEAMESYAERILPGLLAEIKTDEGYAFLRGNEEFQEVLRTAERFTKK